jgi:hypothetical protein
VNGELDPTLCCGVDVYEGINNTGATARDVIMDIANDWLNDYDHLSRKAMVVFTEARRNERRAPRMVTTWDMQQRVAPNPRIPTMWPEFAALVKTEKLGPIVSTPWRVNPNSGNLVRVHTWVTNFFRLRAYARRIDKQYDNEVARMIRRGGGVFDNEGWDL